MCDIHKFSSEENSFFLARSGYSKSFSPKLKRVLGYIKDQKEDSERLEQFFTVHELFIDTLKLCEVLLLIQKKYTLGIHLPFTKVLESSSKIRDFDKSQMKYFYKRISCEEDGESFQKLWNGKQLSSQERYRNSREGWFTKSHSAIKTRMKPDLLQLSLRLSMKNVLEGMDDAPAESKLIAIRNVKYHLISAALTHIDRALLEKLQISDLSKLNTDHPPDIAKTIAEQQHQVMECLCCEVENSTDPIKAVSLLLRVCKHLHHQRNFHSLLTVLLVISKFKEIVKRLKLNHRLYFDRLMSIYDPTGAYRNYRVYVGPLKENALVSFSVFSRDMFLLFEHNKAWVDNEVNEVFLQGVYDQYSTAKRASYLKMIGKVDPMMLNKLWFVEL